MIERIAGLTTPGAVSVPTELTLVALDGSHMVKTVMLWATTVKLWATTVETQRHLRQPEWRQMMRTATKPA